MTKNHLIIPPLELLREWNEEALSIPDPLGWSEYIATQAANWGADRQLEECVAWLDGYERDGWAAKQMRNDLRPKPPSLAENALEALEVEDDSMPLRSLKRAQRFALIRAALNRLKELEQNND